VSCAIGSASDISKTLYVVCDSLKHFMDMCNFRRMPWLSDFLEIDRTITGRLRFRSTPFPIANQNGCSQRQGRRRIFCSRNPPIADAEPVHTYSVLL